MARLRTGGNFLMAIVLMGTIVLVALPAASQELKSYTNEEFGFGMKYPGTWVKIDQPKGAYTAVFQDPNLVDNYRPKIHVAAIKGAKDRLEKYLEETRNGIKDLEKQSVPAEQQSVQLLYEGGFKSDVPGAYFFFLKALEERPRIWVNVIIVFYKFGETLVRISCLAPESAMDQFHGVFNKVLLSLNFEPSAAAQAAPPRPTAVPPPSPGAPARPGPYVQPPAETTPRPEATPVAPQVRPTPAPGTIQPGPPAAVPPEGAPPATQVRPGQPPATQEQAPAPRAPARGPLRKPQPPATGIVE